MISMKNNCPLSQAELNEGSHDPRDLYIDLDLGYISMTDFWSEIS